MPLQTSLNSPGASISSGNSSLQQTQQQPLLNRPTSAYFNSNNNTNPNTLLLTTPANSMSYTMSTQSQHQQAISTNMSNLNAAAGSSTLNNRFQKIQPQHQQQANGNTFVRESQGQQSLRLNQIMAPSMPNIPHSFQQQQSTQQPHQHSIQHPAGLSASQSMQNVNMIASSGIGYQNGNSMMSPQLYLNEQQQQQQQASLLRGQAKIAEMNELIKRRSQSAHSQRPQNQDSSIMPSPSIPQQISYSGTSPHPSTPLAPHKQQLPPTTAPKPHLRPGASDQEHPPLPPTNTHPLFKTSSGSNTGSTINAYSSSDPPKVGFYPTIPQQSKNITPGSNPWEREEKEKETEMRREQMRAWRDQQIAELQSMPQRTLQQDEQLRTLMLDRDFEKRAMEEDTDFDNDSSPYGKDASGVQEVLRLTQTQNTISAPLTKMKQVDVKSSSTQSSEIAYNDGQSINTVANTIANFQQQVASASASIQPKSILKHNNSTPSSPSKSTVKSASFAHHDKQLNLSEITMNNTNANQMLSQMAIDMGQMNLADQGEEDANEGQSNGYPQDAPSNENQGTVPPPPPPERNSSYVIMSQQQKFRNSATKLTFNNTNMILTDHQQQQQNVINNNNNNSNTLGRHSSNLLTTAPASAAVIPGFAVASSTSNASVSSSNNINNNYTAANLSGSAFRDNKRVSFHDEDAAANMLNNNNNNGGGFFSGNSSNIGSSYTEAGHLIGSSGATEQGALGTIMERPDPDVSIQLHFVNNLSKN